MSDQLVAAVHALQRKRFVILAIVTDNATNEIAAVRELAHHAEIPLFRVACLTHTMNLAVQDALEDISGEDHAMFFFESATVNFRRRDRVRISLVRRLLMFFGCRFPASRAIFASAFSDLLFGSFEEGRWNFPESDSRCAGCQRDFPRSIDSGSQNF
jgi:hypothetical protein